MKKIKLFSRVYLIIVWFDMWMGIYYDQQKNRLYVMIPFVGLFIQLGSLKKVEVFVREECIFNYCPTPEKCKNECDAGY